MSAEPSDGQNAQSVSLHTHTFLSHKTIIDTAIVFTIFATISLADQQTDPSLADYPAHVPTSHVIFFGEILTDIKSRWSLLIEKVGPFASPFDPRRKTFVFTCILMIVMRLNSVSQDDTLSGHVCQRDTFPPSYVCELLIDVLFSGR